MFPPFLLFCAVTSSTLPEEGPLAEIGRVDGGQNTNHDCKTHKRNSPHPHSLSTRISDVDGHTEEEESRDEQNTSDEELPYNKGAICPGCSNTIFFTVKDDVDRDEH